MNYAQEPYVILKRSPATPVFDERFVNYGYNKIQLIEHLRHKGYSFLVLMNSYAMDMPHRMSSMRSSFSKHEHEKDSMSGLYVEFRKELQQKYGGQSSLALCTKQTYAHLYLEVDSLD